MVIGLAELGRLIAPAVDNRTQRRFANVGKRCRVIGRVADHPGYTRSARYFEGVGRGQRCVGRRIIREQRGEVVREHERGGVGRVERAVCAHIAGAQVTAWLVGRSAIGRRRRYRPLPRALPALRRDEHPVAGQQIAAAVRLVCRVHAARTSNSAAPSPPKCGSGRPLPASQLPEKRWPGERIAPSAGG